MSTNGTSNFHGPVPAGANIKFVAKVFDDEMTVVTRDDGNFDVYCNNRLTQPNHPANGVLQYLAFAYHSKMEAIAMRAERAAKGAGTK